MATVHKSIRLKMMKESSACARCGRKDKLTLDHIIPVAFLRLMGLEKTYRYDRRNYQLLCTYCNFEKANLFDFKNPRTKELLFIYIGEAYIKQQKDLEEFEKKRKEAEHEHRKRMEIKARLAEVKARNDPVTLGVEFDEFGFPTDAPLWLKRKQERKAKNR